MDPRIMVELGYCPASETHNNPEGVSVAGVYKVSQMVAWLMRATLNDPDALGGQPESDRLRLEATPS